VTVNLDEKTVYVNTGLNIDIYKIEEADLVFQKSIAGRSI
jgi:hypothetical protein